MRKEVKKAVSMALAAVMVLTMGNGAVLKNKTASAADEAKTATGSAIVASCAATLIYSDNDWSNYTEASTIVDGDGEYTITATRDAEDPTNKVGIFDIDLVGIKNKVASFGAIKVTDVKVTADGKEVEVDQDKVTFGDMENKGNYRINVYNMYGNTAENSSIDVDEFFWDKELSVSFKLEGTGWGEKKEVNPYYGFLAFQDSSWNYRNGASDLSSSDYKYLTQAMIGGQAVDLNITNAVMNKKEKASYSVKIDGLNDTLADTTSMKYVFLGTDIPATFDAVKFTNVKYIVDGTVVKELEDASSIVDVDKNTAGVDCYRLSLCNTWNSDEAFNDPNVISAVPMKSMEVQYTIENIPYTVANADQAAYEEALKNSGSSDPTATPTVAPTDTPATTPTVVPNTPVPTVVPTQVPTATQTPVATVTPTKTPVTKTTKNACKKVKAKKAKVSLKKGKKATLKFTVTAATKSKKTTDKMKVSVKNKRIVSVTKKSLKKGAATVTVKGKKKGSTTITVKIGKKSAKTKVTVK